MVNNGNQNSDQALNIIRNHYYGKYRGEVVNNEDPSNRGLIQVRVPSLLEEEIIWAMPCFPYAGPNMGLYMIPEPGTLVWIEFEGGNINRAIWTGCFWADNELPKNEKGDIATPSLKVIRSEKGLMVTMDDAEQVITLSDEDGSNIMTIEVEKGKIRIEGNLKVVVEAPQIELVENSTHPVVFGDNLLNYLNQLVQLYHSHTHIGETIFGVIPVSPWTPTPPFPPATEALVSKKVTTG